MRAVGALLQTGEYSDTHTPALRAAEAARGYCESIRAAQPDAALDSLDDAARDALELAQALADDCEVATGRAEKIDQRARTLAAHGLARASERQASELLRRFALPPELAEVVDGLEPRAAVEAARQFQHSKAATLSARKAKRRTAERQLVVDEIAEAWA
ncbi:hypothetical protein [Alloyangia pacifica]|nr:hypothetical protein [Alloyangia pacifica]